ncbi:MAG TPA: ankyrin repeat domain-containing protein [Bryobacteraceae bacterium]|nr:ankyrin repeat domain-containing protein [Bryobacteraceae bacterium]
MPEHTRIFVAEPSYFEDRAAGLVSVHQGRLPQALAQIREWHPGFAGMADEAIAAASFDLDAARLVYAQEHGSESWDALLERIREIADGRRREPFFDAFTALKNRRWDEFHSLVGAYPDLAWARGTNGNTLLNLAISVAPGEMQIVDLLLERGADVNQGNDRGWTALHQAGYSNKPDLARRLLAAGADPTREGHGEGGTPLAAALFWGHREVAEVLAEAAIAPRNLRIAAGLGRRDLIDECFDESGALKPAAFEGRGFYRPHSGFPVWQPSRDRQEVLNEALVWAAKADRVEVLGSLIERGAEIDADPYRGTALIWAAANNRLAAARWLLEHGAKISRATFGGPSHGEGITALHLAAQNDFAEIAQLLLDHGADVTVEEKNYHSTAAGWAEHFGSKRVGALLGNE